MENNQLAFGSDCVIKLEDLGQFKDYSDTIDELINKLNHMKTHQQSLFCPQLKEILLADPEDTFYIPKFKQLLQIIIQENWLKCSLNENELQIIVKFQMLIVQQCLLSFTFSEQSLKKLLQKCQNYKNIRYFQEILLATLFRLSDKVVYIEDEQSVMFLWSYLDDSTLFDQNSKETIDMKIALYLQSCQKFTRNHRIRRKLNTLSLKNKLILRIKLSLWNRDKLAIQDCLQQLQTSKYFGSNFLRKSINLLNEQCSQ